MKVSGCVDYEPSLKAESKKKLVAEETALEKSMDDTVDRLISEMPVGKREMLDRELDAGADIQYSRGD